MKKLFDRVILLTVIFMILICINIVSMAKFDDIDGHWCEKKIESFYERGFISGDKNTNIFRPNDCITRAELSKIINKYFSFDVDERLEWKTANINIAKEKSYMSITNYDANISREEFCVVVCRAMKVDTLNMKSNNYSDATDISSWAVTSVNYLTDFKNINGYRDNTFKPKRYITRAEVINVLYSIVGIGGMDIDTTETNGLQLGYLTHNEYGIVVTPINDKLEMEKGDSIYLAPILPDNVDEEDIKIEILSGKDCIEYNQEDYEVEAVKIGIVKIKLSSKSDGQMVVVNIIVK